MDEREGSTVPARGARAVEIAEFQDLIELEGRAVRRMRCFELPFQLMVVLFLAGMSVTYDGPPALLLAILFSLLLARRIRRYRHSAGQLSDLEERLSALVEGDMRSSGSREKAG